MSEKAPSHPPLSMRSNPYSGAIAHMMAVLSMQAIAGCDCQQLKSLLTGVLHVINGIAAETGKKSGMRVFPRISRWKAPRHAVSALGAVSTGGSSQRPAPALDAALSASLDPSNHPPAA